ncbi:hypothetical protein C8R46DRAFT_1327877 [Mycena filopes]|nr:hypothetical protein C8R46DRAFT_1327877 [Mycena filopes]
MFILHLFAETGSQEPPVAFTLSLDQDQSCRISLKLRRLRPSICGSVATFLLACSNAVLIGEVLQRKVAVSEDLPPRCAYGALGAKIDLDTAAAVKKRCVGTWINFSRSMGAAKQVRWIDFFSCFRGPKSAPDWRGCTSMKTSDLADRGPGTMDVGLIGVSSLLNRRLQVVDRVPS